MKRVSLIGFGAGGSSNTTLDVNVKQRLHTFMRTKIQPFLVLQDWRIRDKQFGEFTKCAILFE